jgi:hypothetical protein
MTLANIDSSTKSYENIKSYYFQESVLSLGWLYNSDAQDDLDQHRQFKDHHSVNIANMNKGIFVTCERPKVMRAMIFEIIIIIIIIVINFLAIYRPKECNEFKK